MPGVEEVAAAMAAVHPVAFDPSQGALNCSYCDITGAPAIPCLSCGRPPWSVAAGLVMEHEDPRAESEGEVAMELTVHSVAGEGDTSVEDQAHESQNNPWNGYFVTRQAPSGNVMAFVA